MLKINAYIKKYDLELPVSVIDFKNKEIEVDLSYGNGDTSNFGFDEVELLVGGEMRSFEQSGRY